MSAPYLFSKAIDPLFAMGIGIAAAGVRINREEKEKGRSTHESFEGLKRRWNLAMESYGFGKDGLEGEKRLPKKEG